MIAFIPVLVPAIPLSCVQCLHKRVGWHKAGHDEHQRKAHSAACLAKLPCAETR